MSNVTPRSTAASMISEAFNNLATLNGERLKADLLIASVNAQAQLATAAALLAVADAITQNGVHTVQAMAKVGGQ